MFQLHNHLQCEVEEHDFGVSVLSNIPEGGIHHVADGQDIVFVDKAGEIACEVLLL